MSKKMLIDATHAEETRVVVSDGNKVDEFDFESLEKRQLAGNIYLAKVTRVEPSLQAAFVDYGGNRHGFLAFTEIHPDYYQIPVADREKLLKEEADYAKAMAEEDARKADAQKKRGRGRGRKKSAPAAEGADADKVISSEPVTTDDVIDVPVEETGLVDVPEAAGAGDAPVESNAAPAEDDGATEKASDTPEETNAAPEEAPAEEEKPKRRRRRTKAQIEADKAKEEAEKAAAEAEGDSADEADAPEEPESVADDDVQEEVRVRKPRPRRYKIQEVIKVRQIMLVQVVKEERGNKGAALTTYLSLAGRYCVLMPNTARGGGISRKITNAADRKKIKEITNAIDVPEGAGLIVRTAGAKRNKSDINRDYEYLLRQWEQIRDLTLKSIAPAQIYAEGDLIKRTIRDLYNRDIDEIIVEGKEGYDAAREYMTMLMPSHVKKVKHYQDALPLFSRYQVESYLAGMFNPTVQLKSGGYIVIGVTEALVAVDVNSGRATKEGSIEETALRTNLEAAEEVARQMRLRDLAGLIVIDFIDMEERRNNNAVEKRLKDRLKNDRARIQVGRISSFGLLEMSRQRLRPGMLEASTAPCPHCHGTGLIRSDNSQALSILREIEEEAVRRRAKEIQVKAPVEISNYLLNHKREHITDIEARFGIPVTVMGDTKLISPDHAIEGLKVSSRIVRATVEESAVTLDSTQFDDLPEEAETPEDEDGPKKKRRRRKRGGRGRNKNKAVEENGEENAEAPAENAEPEAKAADEPDGEAEAVAEEAPKKPRRGRKKKSEAAESAEEETAVAEVKDTEEDEKPEKKKRAPRKRKTKAEKEAEEAAAAPAEQAEEEAAPAEEKPAKKPRKRAAKKPAKEAAAEEPAEPEMATVEAAATTEPVAAAESEDKPEKKKRRGWWSRS